ncbi:hypothetical protein HY624_02420 [Candidatus Uhrbacteria bacterium]|nr:hypothetical protein [Candidatus Uhrbacteria bacterium]
MTDVKYMAEPTPQKKSTVITIASIVFAVLAYYAGSYVVRKFYPRKDKQAAISEIVAEAKRQLSLPKQLDEFNTLVDITAEPNAIRYHKTLVGIDTSELTNDGLKTALGPNVCANKDTRSLLDKDMNVEYAYTVQGSAETYFFAVSKEDCK